MNRIFGHPTFVALSRYADGELDSRRRARVASHLVRCARCRETVDFIHALGEAARSLPAPEPPADAVERFLARRASGERVILPTADPVPLETGRGRIGPLVAATVAALIAAAVLVTVPRLDAERSRLEFSPRRPEAGGRVTVTYTSGALLGGEDVLVLRARYRYRGGTQETLEVGRLARDPRGDFRAEITLPDSLAYATFAVEDTTGEKIDLNHRRLWEVLVHDRRGRPLFEALRERTNDLVGRDWELAYETVQAMTDLYPNRVEGWYTRYWLESSIFSGATLDSLRDEHRERLAELAGRLDDGPAPASEIAAVVLFASALGDAERGRAAIERLISEAPTHPVAVQLRVSEYTRELEGDDAALLEAYERLWTESGGRSRELAWVAFRTARSSNDSPAALRWGERLVQLDTRETPTIGEALLRMPVLTAEVGRLITETLAALEAGASEGRKLHEPHSRWKFRVSREASRHRVALARALLAEGDRDAALEALQLATTQSWDPEVFRSAAALFTEIGDAESMVRALARLAVDPATTPAEAESLAESASRKVSLDQWRALTGQAEAEYRSLMLRRAVSRRIGMDTPLRGPDGSRRPLRDLIDDEITLVSYWSCFCGPALSRVDDVRQLNETLEMLGIRTVVIANGSLPVPPSIDGAPELPEPIYMDESGELGLDVQPWDVPQLFILDRNGRVRFEPDDPELALRQAYALLLEQQPEPVLAAP